jgi:murein DD-endopeptidase MepM/ murein hydrolase activator NlpD
MEMYMDAATSSGAVMLAVSSGADLTVGLAYVDGLAGDSEDLMDSFEILKRDEERQQSDLEASRVALDAQLADLEEQRSVLAAELAEVEDLRHQAEDELAEAQALLDRIRNEIAGYEQHKNSLEEDAARLQRELASRQSTGGSNPGVLAWPVAGAVSSPFGYRIHPIFGTRKLHTGIDISASSGTPIKAAGSGVVLIAGPYGGYGNAVVVDHGGGLATLYAHQSTLAVSNGQKVDAGQIIGYVGCSGFCTGPHLHFETRENGVPVDPMKYLG